MNLEMLRLKSKFEVITILTIIVEISLMIYLSNFVEYKIFAHPHGGELRVDNVMYENKNVIILSLFTLSVLQVCMFSVVRYFKSSS